jgi:DNA helicase HerA-like ATPase
MPQDSLTTALTYLRKVDFDWVLHTKSVWSDTHYDVDSMQKECRDFVQAKVDELRLAGNDTSPIGVALIGQAGSGKTHLLSSICRTVISQGLGFVLVDMTGVKDFWVTVLQGYVSSLQVDLGNGVTQLSQLIQFLIDLTAQLDPSSIGLFDHTSPSKASLNGVLSALAKQHMFQTLKHQDTIRALFLLNSTDISVASTGYYWLQGLEIEESVKSEYGFSGLNSNDSSSIVVSLSWVMSLNAPTVLAFDQLDSIVTQHHLASGSGLSETLQDEQSASKAIIEGLSGGLTALHSTLFRTLSLVSCLESTWDILKTQTISTFCARFDSIFLKEINNAQMAELMIVSRLKNAQVELNYTPPYPSWPFKDGFFTGAVPLYPRILLQKCNAHRQECLRKNVITELNSFTPVISISQPPSVSKLLDAEFELLRSSQVAKIDETSEDELLPDLLLVALECLIRENPLPSGVDSQIETSFPSGRNFPLLHARLRLIYREEGDREQHFSLRALQKSHPISFQSRLKAALTSAGIDRKLPHRKLVMVRTEPFPSGAKTSQLIDQFLDLGGEFVFPVIDDIQTMQALKQLMSRQHPEFEDWLQARRPVSSLPIFKDARAWLFGESTSHRETPTLLVQSADPNVISDHGAGVLSVVQDGTSSGVGDVDSDLDRLPIGFQLIGQQAHQAVTVSSKYLTNHTVVLAGSGSGKTVLVRRIVEEAILKGIPTIVVDGANDLVRMGDRWPVPPESWREEDLRKAEDYHRNVDVVIWTPGRESGNPLNLDPIPDLAALAKNHEELDQATTMAVDSLIGYIASGNSNVVTLKEAILKASLTYLAFRGGGKLPELIELLADLPVEASGGISVANSKGREMADALRAAILRDPLLRQTGSALDPSSLFGLDSYSSRTRVSVINLVGLPSITSSQQFLNQLAMTLFTWVKKNPAPPEKPIRGLLVLDEAKDYVPSISSTPCKKSLIRLVAQARKYGLGIIFATQAPKSIDHNIIANCSTHFYGRVNSPTAINVISEQIKQKGGDGNDISQLNSGQFYVFSEGLCPPVKIQAPMCLSYHPLTPLSEDDVILKASQLRLE